MDPEIGRWEKMKNNMKDQKIEPNDDPKELTDEEWEIIWIDEDEFNLDTD